MDLLALGTSNCIGSESFVERLRCHTGSRLHNLSIGACSSNLGLYLADEIPRASRGVALVDYCINDTDAGLNLWGASARGIISDNLQAIVWNAHAGGYLPIVVIVPFDLDLESAQLAETVMCDFCLQQHIHFINLREMFRRALARGAAHAALMRDAYHMNGRAADLVARLFAALLAQMRRSESDSAPRSVSVVSSRVISARELFAEDALVERRTSLRQAFYGLQHTGERIRIPARPGERLAAIMINTAAPGAIVSCRGTNTEVVKSMTAYWQDRPPVSFSAMLIDFGRRIASDGAGLTMDILPGNAAPTEPTIHGRPVRPDRYGEVEIEGILLTSSDRRVVELPGPADPRMPVDLAEAPQSRRLIDELLNV